MKREPKVAYKRRKELQSDPWKKLRERPGVRVISKGRRKP